MVQLSLGSDPRRALLVDDEAIFRTLIAHAVEGFGFEVRTASNAETAAALVPEFDPDIVIADLELGAGPSGTDLVNHVAAHHPEVALLIVSSHRSADMVESVSGQIGDHVGYVVKGDIIDLDFLRTAIEDTLNLQPPRVPIAAGIARLTRTQAEVLRLLADGLSNAAIAEQRGCSMRSLERLIARLYEALGITDDDSGVNPRVLAARRYREHRIST